MSLLYQFLNHGDILLGDRAFCAYADIVTLLKLNCDAVFRKHQAWTTSIAHKAVSDRPGRSEARVHKRRPKAYPLMTKPRHKLRKQLQTA
ncbi:hypothetical protein [Nostoc sp.]|uniref:hypothetical protein n=1 Tax=Nostoc sp. TaxID=1180 RepID=UPI002FF9F070